MSRLFTGTLLATAFTLALAGGPAVAQNPSYPGNERGFSVGAGIGQFNVDLEGLDDVDDVISDLDSDDTSWKIYAAYRFNRFFSVEAAYIDFGSPGDNFQATGSSGDYSLNLSGLAPYLVGTIPLGLFELFGKVGYYFYDVDVDVDLDSGEVFQSDDSGEDIVYAAGVGMTFFERLNARLEYEIVDIRGTEDADAFWLSAAWRF